MKKVSFPIISSQNLFRFRFMVWLFLAQITLVLIHVLTPVEEWMRGFTATSRVAPFIFSCHIEQEERGNFA
jgi:hypothetical protein